MRNFVKDQDSIGGYFVDGPNVQDKLNKRYLNLYFDKVHLRANFKSLVSSSMQNRRNFIKQASFLTAGIMVAPKLISSDGLICCWKNLNEE